jgi:hypothetical protein
MIELNTSEKGKLWEIIGRKATGLFYLSSYLGGWQPVATRIHSVFSMDLVKVFLFALFQNRREL